MKEEHGPLKEQRGHGSHWQQQAPQEKRGAQGERGERKAQKAQREQREQRAQGKQQVISFGNYELIRRIDVGGMGEVYLAHQRTAFGREVAVKIIRSDLTHDVMARKRFLREAEVNAHLKHEHILSLVEFGEEQGRMFLVTPYIAGGTLAQRLQRGPMLLSEVHQIFTALVKAVAYIHKRGVVHRDLKPSNILLDYEDGQLNVRLIDFGIASIQGSAENPIPALTQAGHEMATIDYMAPERLDGIAAPSNDIYSLGIILYEMLTGQRPTVHEEHDKPVKLSAPMRYVVEHCTYTNPEERFYNADQLLNVFEQAYRAVTTQGSIPVVSSQQVETTTPHVVDAGGNEKEDETPRRVPHPVVPAVASTSLTPAAPIVPVAPIVASNTRTFTGSDYNDSTTFVNPDRLTSQGQQTATFTPQKSRHKRSLLLVLSLVSLAIMLLIVSVGYIAFINSIAATVNVGPQVHTVTSVLTIQAKPGQHGVDMNASTVPAYILTSTKTGSQTGNTTGVKCTLFVINCQPAVSFSDIDTLATALRQSLKTQIQQDLRTQGQANGATTVGQTYYSDSNLTSNPTEGTVSNTVTVTLTEQGSVEYIKSQDIQSLARNLLTQKAQQQYGSGYTLLSTYTRIGTPAVQSVDASGIVTTKIAVGGVVEYNLSSSVMQSFENAIKGKKQQDASNYLMHQTGIDASTVVVHVTYGDTVPGDIRQIHIVPLNPTNIPNVQLPTT